MLRFISKHGAFYGYGFRLSEPGTPSPPLRARRDSACDAFHVLGDYYVGYGAEMGQARRMKPASPIFKEYNKDLYVKGRVEPGDPVTARWPGGFEHELVQVTVARFTARLKAQAEEKTKGGRKGDELYRNGDLFVRKKKDRALLLWIGKDLGKDKQLCQFLVSDEKAATDIMNTIVDEMKLDPEAQPLQIRGRILDTYGIHDMKRRRRTTKQPEDPTTTNVAPDPIDEHTNNNDVSAPPAEGSTAQRAGLEAAPSTPAPLARPRDLDHILPMDWAPNPSDADW